ncbi:MAG TPA: DUF6015 family protein [Thermoplasmata archaeon]|nr:DUF6015 family protein [Thermoplasmata archaeon]
MPVVTMSELRAALRVTVGKRGMTEEDVDALADYLMSFFGFDSEVIDNRLDMDDRDVFYMIEEAGLLSTRQEEIHIKKGKLWRIHYWVLRTARIKALAGTRVPKVVATGFAYDHLPAEAWERTPIAK